MLHGESLRVCTLNVRSLNDLGGKELLDKELTKFNIGIAGLQEVRWPSSGEIQEGYTTLLWSGRKDDQRTEGVAIALAPYVTRALVSWTPISERLLKARFQHQRGHLTIMVIYAPTDQTDRAMKEDFYALLDDTVQSVPPGDLLVCLGDFNAVSGTDRLPNDQVLGPFGSGNPNENSDLFLAFARNHRLRIGGSWYRRCCWYC